MLNKGYRYSRPQDVLRQADLTLAGNYQQSVDQKQIESANAKLETTRKIANTCYQKVDLGEIRQQVRIEYENRFVEQYQTRLTD